MKIKIRWGTGSREVNYAAARHSFKKLYSLEINISGSFGCWRCVFGSYHDTFLFSYFRVPPWDGKFLIYPWPCHTHSAQPTSFLIDAQVCLYHFQSRLASAFSPVSFPLSGHNPPEVATCCCTANVNIKPSLNLKDADTLMWICNKETNNPSRQVTPSVSYHICDFASCQCADILMCYSSFHLKEERSNNLRQQQRWWQHKQNL